MQNKRVVIANSVGIDSRGYYIMHSPSRWSQGVKNAKDLFTYYPWELAYLSSLLKRDTEHHVKFIDGCLEKFNLEQYKERIALLEPNYIVMEPSTRTLEEDISLALWSKEKFGTKIVFCGQHATAYPEDLLSRGVDFACQGEYEFTVLDILLDKSLDSIRGLYPNQRRELLDVKLLPFPEDEDVRRIDYATPGEPNCEYLEIQMYASRGCPLMCLFCVAQNLYYGKSSHRIRRVESVVEEIKLLKNKYPEMEGVFFDEEMHNADKNFVMELTSAIKKAGLDNLKYNAMCGHWTLDREMLEAMKSAGYYKIRVGVETADPMGAIGMRIGPKNRLDKLEENLKIAREIGMKVYATFTIGGMGSSKDGDRKTGELIQRLVGEGLLTDIQVSINTPLPGSPYFERVKRMGYLLEQDWSKFDGGNFSVVSYPNYSKNEIEENFRYVLKCYDEGLKCQKEFSFKSKLSEDVNKFELSSMKKILFLRSNRMWQVELTADLLKEFSEKIEIDVIGQPQVENILKKLPCVKKIYLYEGGFFTLDNFKKQFDSRFDKKYDAVFIFYNNFRRVGYSEVEAIANSIQAEFVAEVFPDGSLKINHE